MTTQALAEVRQTVLGWLRNDSSASAPMTPKRAATVRREASGSDAPRETVNEGTLNLLLLAMFSSATRMDSFGNFR